MNESIYNLACSLVSEAMFSLAWSLPLPLPLLNVEEMFKNEMTKRRCSSGDVSFK